MFQIVPYEAQSIGKLAVGILLEYLFANDLSR